MCYAMTPRVLTRVDSPLQLVQRDTHRRQASDHVNMYGRVRRLMLALQDDRLGADR